MKILDTIRLTSGTASFPTRAGQQKLIVAKLRVEEGVVVNNEPEIQWRSGHSARDIKNDCRGCLWLSETLDSKQLL